MTTKKQVSTSRTKVSNKAATKSSAGARKTTTDRTNRTIIKKPIYDRIFESAKSLAASRLVVLVVIVLVAVGAVFLIKDATNGGTTPSTEAAQRELQAKVDTANGEPRSGRDPASQPQNSLASAASKPSGVGQRVDKPAANISDTESNRQPTDPADVMHHGSDHSSRTLASGCLADYGKPGEQCLPARAPNDQPVTCDFVRKQFPQGIKVTGTDHLKLDKNGDKIACGAGD